MKAIVKAYQCHVGLFSIVVQVVQVLRFMLNPMGHSWDLGSRLSELTVQLPSSAAQHCPCSVAPEVV